MCRPCLACALLAACFVVSPAAARANWRNHVATEIPYRVDTNAGRLKVHCAPGADRPVIDLLPAGAGGLMIQDCNDDASWCLVSYGGRGAKGWVSMKYLTGYAD